MSTSSPRWSNAQRALARIGTVVQNCRIERLIGIGGMSVVYAAVRPDERRVAVKYMLERFRDDPDMLQLFMRESNVANLVGHPGAVPVLDCNMDEEGCAFLIMPLLEGETVRVRWERSSSRLPVEEVLVIISDVLDVLASAHARGIVHRDIKPENLFITGEGELRVLDFGIARRIDRDGSATITGYTIGTPAFMAPEQALGTRVAVGPASDCWAVGASMFSLLSGELVHVAEGPQAQLAAAATRQARSLGDVAPNLPPALIRFVDRALAFEPKDRWSTAAEMREALQAVFEVVLRESVEDVAKRVRTKFAAELSQQTAPTHLSHLRRKVNPRPPSRPWTRFLHPDVEVTAVLPKLFGSITPTASRILAEYGLGQFSETGWFIPDTRAFWPMEPYVLALHALMAAVGPIRAMDIGKQAVSHVTLPPDPMMNNIHAFLASLDIAYHLNHRRNGQRHFDVESGHMVDDIGHYHYRGKLDSEQSAVMECENPYPCDMDLGIILGFARRFEPRAVVEHAPGPCRNEGADSCVYHVSWW
ncbi:serine/threonine protein kinase [Pendulispora brunnea]|uniref:Serine/threonine protein kinase n=1 Tax=Pendulispora brunnea TaxID=2905690 RepID=A0ABZ2KVK9_9BACT